MSQEDQPEWGSPSRILEAAGRLELVEESSTFQFVLRRGRIEGVRDVLFDLGASKFGHPADAETQSQIESIIDLERPTALRRRLLFVSSWAELLAEA